MVQSCNQIFIFHFRLLSVAADWFYTAGWWLPSVKLGNKNMQTQPAGEPKSSVRKMNSHMYVDLTPSAIRDKAKKLHICRPKPHFFS